MFARTDRLLLRPAWGEDAPALFAAIGDEGIVRNLASAPWPYRPADAEKWVTTPRSIERPASLIFLRGDAAPELIGAIGIHDTPAGEVELGYWIARAHWGRGYATEAGRAMIAHARHGLRLERLVASHFLDNPASGRVLRKLGFQPTGIVRSCHSAGRGGDAPCAGLVLELNRRDTEDCRAAEAACSALAA